MIAILGSGFGLYGYLPAIIDGCKERVLLPERYRNKFNERPELQRFVSNIEWKKNDSLLLESASGVVIALNPVKQDKWIEECLKYPNINSLILEKPLAYSPERALILFKNLINSGKTFRIGYTFRYTEWAKQLTHILSVRSKNKKLIVRWSFMAHHYRNKLQNWKKFNSFGGGAIRFYGIHIIALLAEIGYSNITISSAYGDQADEVEKWNAIFTGLELPDCEVTIDSKSSIDKFNIELVSNSNLNFEISNLSDPFESMNNVNKFPDLDKRIPILSELCNSIGEESKGEYERYGATIKLWLLAEKIGKFKR
jgi:hypothetical protein